MSPSSVWSRPGEQSPLELSVSRVLIANRGEIAVRIVRACRALELECVVASSDFDRDGLAARLADRVVVIGPGPAAESYLRHEAIVQAALGTGCDAIHPGYGFLAENPALAAAAAEHGVRFVGPPAEVIELAGDKLRARAAAEEAGLPLVPGREVEALPEALEFAEEHGYPIMVKAAAGGGGRGIKLAADRAQLESAFPVAMAEARGAFGDERLYAERFIPRARHLEVQVAADDAGSVIHLGERECSVQRRYQKLIEEAPAPNLTEETRAGLREAGVAFARAISYRNLGTVEFVLDADSGDFHFLEMNCRIQVEHPVTETVTGRDLVAEQLSIAGGAQLSLGQSEVELDGHAIECRLTAEDEAFRPSPGTITRFDVPALPELRVDTHCEAGTTIPPFYDSLMAKLIAHGPTRESALETMRRALDGLRVEGVHTNRDALASVLADPDFEAGAVTTRWLEERAQ